MMRSARARRLAALLWLLFFPVWLAAETVRVGSADVLEISADRPSGQQTTIPVNGAAIVFLEKDTRFFSAVEFEITAPSSWIAYRGALAAVFYSGADQKNAAAPVSDMQVKEIRSDPLPNKIQTVYQIPVKHGHSLKTSPYVSILREPVLPAEFPVLFRIVPLNVQHGDEVDDMEFRVSVKPVFSDEGAMRVMLRYPEHLPDRPVAVLIDGKVIENPSAERLLKEGEHHITVLSNDYRSQSRRFMVERGKTLMVTLTLHDLTPQMIFEAPANARVFLDDKLVHNISGAVTVEAGKHDVKIQVSDYSIIRSINVQKGKTYRISFTVDMAISEHD
jgi:hypothetical protein